MIPRWLLPVMAFAGHCLPLQAAPMTVGWHLPLELAQKLCPQLKEKWRKLDHAPAESPFFQPGDELWDLSPAMTWRTTLVGGNVPREDTAAPVTLEGAWTGVFVVWDARSRQVVARGEPHEIRALENALGYRTQPLNLQTKVEVVADPPPEGVGSVRTLTLTCGDQADALQNTEALSASVTGNWLFDDAGEVEVEVEWPDGDVTVNLKTHVTLREGHRTCVLKRPHQQVFLTVIRTLPDGTSYGMSRTLEKPQGIVPWPVSDDEEAPQSGKQGDAQFTLYSPARFPGGQLPNLGATDSPKAVATPAALRALAGPAVIDLTAFLAATGTVLDFAGYDPFAQVFVALGREEPLEAARTLYTPMGCKVLSPNFRVERSGGQGPLELLCTADHEASLTLSRSGETGRLLELKIAGPPPHYRLTLHQRLDSAAAGSAESSLESETDFQEDVAVPLGRIKDADGEASYAATLARCRE